MINTSVRREGRREQGAGGDGGDGEAGGDGGVSLDQ